jgi:hypothetical protein
VTARVCSACGVPIGQPPVVADTLAADAEVAAVSGAGREAVPAGVVGRVLPEPYVPGSGDRVAGELRLVLARYVGLAVGEFAAGLACAVAVVFTFFVDPIDLEELAFGLVLVAVFSLLGVCPWRTSCSMRVPGFRGCSGGPAIHTRPR